MTDPEYRIDATGLTKRYGDHVAVDAIDLRVGAGEFFGFLGPNGAGKSTTIQMLCGQLPPTAGRITVAGIDITHDPIAVKRHIGILNEESVLYERLSGAEWLCFAGQMYGLSSRESRRRTEELLDLMELTDAGDKLIADYSMGMKKKTALATALIHGPSVLFLDEPFNGMDAVSVRSLCDVLKELTTRSGTAIFFTSHVLEMVERLCTRIAILNRGRIVADGTVAELRARAEAAGDATLEDLYLHLVDAPPRRTETLSWL